MFVACPRGNQEACCRSPSALLDRVPSPQCTPHPPPPADAPQSFSRALLALTAAATLAVTPLAAPAIAPANSGQSAHSIPVYLISRLSHDVGHNDWAFQGQTAGRVAWAVSYLALALFWLLITLWLRARTHNSDNMNATAAREPRPHNWKHAPNPSHEVRTVPSSHLWRHVLIAAWSAEAITGFLTLGAGAYAAWTSTPLGPTVLRAADLCSPWWSCVAAVLVVARSERSTIAFRAILGYGLMLAIVLLVPLPGPDALKVLLLALPAAIPAVLAEGSAPSIARDVRQDAVAAG